MEVSFDSDEGEDSGGLELELWDNVEEVSSTFISKGKSKEPGMLTTHNMQYKVLEIDWHELGLSVDNILQEVTLE